MRALVTLALSLSLLLGFALPAAALQTGSPAWTLKAQLLFEGPGTAYDITGEVQADARVYVDRCSKDWCQIHVGHQRGWVSLYALTFGQRPQPFTGPRLKIKVGDPGTVCLYEGRNFTGEALCGERGFVVRDLLLLHKDNRYSSVSIEGNASVLLCRDRDFKSYCVRVTQSQARLHGFLDNNVTSLRVY
ncbi:MAG: SH3 domain-containing protein [Devosia sp.]